MITYKDFIKRMEERGYYLKNKVPVPLHEDDFVAKTFIVEKGSTCKILEITCPDNSIIATCGKTHEGGCDRVYDCYIKCFDESGKEPFQGLHHSTKITNQYHILAELVVTKILTKDPDTTNIVMKEWLESTNPILRVVGIDNPREYTMWYGAYKFFSEKFLETSLNLYPGEKMVFYVTNPDIDIINVKFKLNVDILEKSEDSLASPISESISERIKVEA